jgi:hypothetical protein
VTRHYRPEIGNTIVLMLVAAMAAARMILVAVPLLRLRSRRA